MPELTYDDGLQFIYFYTKGSKGGCNTIKNMLKYMRNSNIRNAVDDATREIHSLLSQVKIDPEVKVGYMKFEEIIYYQRRDAREEGRQEGWKEAKIDAILELLDEYGAVPEVIHVRLADEKDEAVLKKLHKLAAKVCSIEEFVAKMNN